MPTPPRAVPYALELHPRAAPGLAAAADAFSGSVVLYSNSAGLTQFDPRVRLLFGAAGAAKAKPAARGLRATCADN